MSTAARPTFHAAQGRASHGGFRSTSQSAKDQLAHTKLKFRRLGQSSTQERESVAKKDLKSTLEKSERLLLESKGIHIPLKNQEVPITGEVEKTSVKLLLTNEEEEIDLNEIKKKYDDEDVDYEQNSDDGFESRLDVLSCLV